MATTRSAGFQHGAMLSLYWGRGRLTAFFCPAQIFAFFAPLREPIPFVPSWQKSVFDPCPSVARKHFNWFFPDWASDFGSIPREFRDLVWSILPSS